MLPELRPETMNCVAHSGSVRVGSSQRSCNETRGPGGDVPDTGVADGETVDPLETVLVAHGHQAGDLAQPQRAGGAVDGHPLRE